MSEEKRRKELGVARISTKIFLLKLAEVLDAPELGKVDPTSIVFGGERSSVDAQGNIIIELSSLEKPDSSVLRINTLLEEISHYAYDQVNEDAIEFKNEAPTKYVLSGPDKNEHIKALMRDKNMLEFFAKLCALHILTRDDVKERLEHLLKKPQHTPAQVEKYVEHLTKFAYNHEVTECQRLARDEDNAVSQLEYMEAYALISSLPEEVIKTVDLSAVSRLPFSELREWAYSAVEKENRGEAKRIREWYQKLEHDYIDSGFWEMGLRDRS